ARRLVGHRVFALLPVRRTGPLIVAIFVAVSSLLAAKERRSRAVTREFQREHRAPSPRRPAARAPATVGITSSRSPAADPTRSQTCNETIAARLRRQRFPDAAAPRREPCAQHLFCPISRSPCAGSLCVIPV